MLETYFNQCLADFGFQPEDMSLYWSVGFCQGDYVTFNGPIRFEPMKKLMMKMHGLDIGPESETYPLCPDSLHQMLTVLRDFGSCDLALTHYGSGKALSLDTSDDFEELFDYYYQPMIVAYNDTVKFEVNRVWQQEWKAFQNWLLSSTKALCETMLYNAHAILLAQQSQSEVVREKHFGNYIVQIYEMHDEHFNLDLVDEQLCRDIFKDLIEGKQRVCAIQAVVLDRPSKRILGSSSLRSYCGNFSSQDSYYLTLQQEVVNEAIAETRELFVRHKRMA